MFQSPSHRGGGAAAINRLGWNANRIVSTPFSGGGGAARNLSRRRRSALGGPICFNPLLIGEAAPPVRDGNGWVPLAIISFNPLLIGEAGPPRAYRRRGSE